jgi:hypothetical protein
MRKVDSITYANSVSLSRRTPSESAWLAQVISIINGINCIVVIF